MINVTYKSFDFMEDAHNPGESEGHLAKQKSVKTQDVNL